MNVERHRAYEELEELTDRAGVLTARIIRAERYKVESDLLEPVYEGLWDFYETEVWLRFLLAVKPDCFCYPAGGPGEVPPALFGVGRVNAWIDNYPKVCVDGMARLMEGFRATSGQKASPPPAGTSGTRTRVKMGRPAKPKAPSVPDRYRPAVELWPTFELEMQEAKARATIRKFRDWLKKRSRPILLDDKFENWWNNTYRRQLRRSSN